MAYLDNAATTYPVWRREDVRSDYTWMNTNAHYASKANRELENAKKIIMKYLNVSSGKLLFFRCATEAVQWLAHNGIGTICSVFEHDSVHDVYWKTDSPSVDVHQYVNQLTGDVFDIASIAKKNKCSNLFLSDFTAAIGKVEPPKNLDSFCDAVWFSGHKFHTEKGIGALWISDKLYNLVKSSLSNSTKNQYDLVHGTLDVAGVKMIAQAMQDYCEPSSLFRHEQHCLELSDMILKELRAAGIECKYITNSSIRTHAINALYFKDIDGDSLANYLASQDIFVGLGHSACAEEADYRLLREGYHLTEDEARNIIRISFGRFTDDDEVHYLINQIIMYYKTYLEMTN